MEFSEVLDKLGDTACIPFYGSDIVMVKYLGEYVFFEKNLPQTCRPFEPYTVIRGKIAGVKNECFVQDILKKFYKNGMTYEEYRRRQVLFRLYENHYPILSDTILSKFRQPSFYYFPAWTVTTKKAEEAIALMKIENIVPQVQEIRYLDDTPIPQLFVQAFKVFGASVIDIARKIFGGETAKGYTDTPADQIQKALLECDTDRCALPPYEKLMLSDPNRGHWDVFEDKDKEKYGFKARDPKQDINKLVVGIDFGTRSTVVYYRNESTQILPIAVGGSKGSFDSKERYENPTIMHFISYDKFFKAYKAKDGRPCTKWTDLNVAHQAKEDFLERAKSVEYCQYLSEIKQWASRSILVAVEDSEGVSKNLPPFLQIEANDFNPIEVYAYFIGLYINRMNPTKNIFFTYYLSFPVTCEDVVKEKIRLSFERGLKKSLPSSLLADEELMKKFKVYCENSEPTAYAATALKEFGFGKKDTDYAVFDFGGGTTDYDFGHWAVLEGNRQYSNSIESFGGQGIGTCGGENILLDLAFDVFKRNIKITNAEGKFYPFLSNSSNEGFVGSDKFCPGTAQARKNTRILMEILRPFWEKSELYLEKDDLPERCKLSQDMEHGDIEISLTLYDVENEPKPMSIFANRTEIRDFVKGKVQEAVDGFFAALSGKRDKFSSTDIKIFLAGNSSKSRYVKEIFEERKNNTDNGLQLQIYYPLGTVDAVNQIKESNPEYQLRDDSPTCKSGVAYGLILLRKGGKIQVIRNPETPSDYIYYIGTDDGDGNFLLLETIDTESHKPELNVWYEFSVAFDTEFEFYCTDKPAALNEGNRLIADGQTKWLSGDEISESDVEEGKTIFIRAISSHRIEYAVSDCIDNIDEKMVKSIDFE